MGSVTSVFEAIGRRCPGNTPDPWTKDINEQRRLVVATRRVLGLDWSYKVHCNGCANVCCTSPLMFNEDDR